MRIEISAATEPPPRGEVRVDEGPVQPFAGWLQLLSILAETLPLPDGDTSFAGQVTPHQRDDKYQ